MLSLGGAEEIHIVEFCFLTPVLTGSSDEGQQPCGRFSAFGTPSKFQYNQFLKNVKKKMEAQFHLFCNKYNIHLEKYPVFLFYTKLI